MDQNNNRIDCTFVTLEGEDYANWGNSDDYIINYVANKLGFTIQNVSSTNTTHVIDTSPVIDTSE